ncbi:MAG: glutamate--tRNA ligase, partial [Anaerolineae bacterium]|nr:glutamate--tRNA ligase [Anaerolineae bacterium]
REVFTPEDAIAAFSIDSINPSPAAFPYDKLVWLDGMYIRQLDDDDLYHRLIPFVAQGVGLSETEMAARPELRPAVPLIKERIKTLTEAAPMLSFFFVDGPITYPEPAALIGDKMTAAQSLAALAATSDALSVLAEWGHDSIETCLRELAVTLGLKVRQLLAIVRVAVTAAAVSPPLFETLAILGRERTLLRLASAGEALLPLS